MKQKRLLLPFTHGVDTRAIDQAMQIAKKEHALLMALSLLPEHEPSQRLRLEHIQQSKDFLEAVKHKAARYQVPVEPFELHTKHAVQAITDFAHKHKVSAVLLFTRDAKGVLLATKQIQHLLEKQATRFYVVQLPITFSKRILRNVIASPGRLIRRFSAKTPATAAGNM